MKHAYLILAHNEFGLLQTLVSCLDDPRNDIFVHIDRKVPVLPELHAAHAGLSFVADREDIRWGDWSMVEAEYVLFQAASASGPYAFYHLLSGVDLPLRSQDYIHGFFDAHSSKQFIGYTMTEMTPELVRRMQRWHLFPRHFGRTRDFYGIPRAVFLRLQEFLGIKRNRGVEFKQGSQWVSVTDAMVRYVLEHKDWARKTFTHTFVPDESFMQTICWMSPFRKDLYDITDDAVGSKRAIGWKDGNLKDFCASDYEALATTPGLFARKFNSSDPEFIARILELAKR